MVNLFLALSDWIKAIDNKYGTGSSKFIGEALKIEVGENYWSYQAEQYLSESIIAKAVDKKYGSGSSKFIGEALKFYAEK